MASKMNLEYHYIPYGTSDWYIFRKRGLGGSEIGTVLEEDEYGNLAKLYHKKLGVIDFSDLDSEPMFHGRNLEDYVANIWRHWWNGEYLENFAKKNKVRKCRRVNAYVINPKYPWLYASIDRLIPAGQPKLSGEILEKPGILEVKTISGFEANKWKVGIPRKYVLQVHQYMLIYEVDYAEIIIMKDGRFVEVFAIERDEEIIEKLLHKSEQFWMMVVKPGKRWAEAYFKAKKEGNENEAENAMAYIDGYEPSPEGSKSYREHMNERFTKEVESFMGDEHDMKMAILQKAAGVMMKEVEKMKREAENNLAKKFVDTSAEYLSFGDEEGYVRFYTKSNGKNPTLDNRVKADLPSKDLEALSDHIRIALHEVKETAYRNC